MPRTIKYKKNEFIEPCPKCGNNTEFTVYSQQVAEDYCNIWAKCKCGFDPTENDTNYRIEDVWGGTDDGNCQAALTYSWNEPIIDEREKVIVKP